MKVRSYYRLVFGLILWVCPIASTFLFSADPASFVIRNEIKDTDGAVWVGQRVVLEVSVLSSDGWASIPKLPTFRIPGVLVYSAGSRPITINERIGRESYSGQRHEVWLYPQRVGRFIIPELEVAAVVSVFGGASEKAEVSTLTQSMSFEVQEPPETELDLPLVSASGFSITQRWIPETAEAVVGDGIIREITMTASGVPGMVLPPMRQPKVVALRGYPKQPTISDTSNRGSLTGKRVEAVTCVFEGEGQFTLPELIYQWWNPDTETLQQIVLPGRIVQVTPAALIPVEGDPLGESANQLSLRYWISLLIVILIMGSILWSQRGRIRLRWTRYQAERRVSELAYFRKFETAADMNDSVATFNALMRWLDKLSQADGQSNVLLSEFVASTGNVHLIEEINNLVGVVNKSESQTWQSSSLKAGFRLARKTVLKERTRRGKNAVLLPRLNSPKSPNN